MKRRRHWFKQCPPPDRDPEGLTDAEQCPRCWAIWQIVKVTYPYSGTVRLYWARVSERGVEL